MRLRLSDIQIAQLTMDGEKKQQMAYAVYINNCTPHKLVVCTQIHCACVQRIDWDVQLHLRYNCGTLCQRMHFVCSAIAFNDIMYASRHAARVFVWMRKLHRKPVTFGYLSQSIDWGESRLIERVSLKYTFYIPWPINLDGIGSNGSPQVIHETVISFLLQLKQKKVIGRTRSSRRVSRRTHSNQRNEQVVMTSDGRRSAAHTINLVALSLCLATRYEVHLRSI